MSDSAGGSGNVRAVAGNTLVQVIGNVVIRLIDLAVVLLLTRFLSLADFGRFSFLITVFTFCGVIADAGLYAVLVREYSGERAPGSLLANAFSIGLLSSIATAVAANLAVYLLGYGHLIHLSMIASLSIVLSPRINALRRLLHVRFHASLKLGTVVFWATASYVILLVLLVPTLYWQGSLRSVFVVFIAAELLSFIGLLISHVRQYGWPGLSVDLALWRDLLAQSLPVMVSGLLATICGKSSALLLEPLIGEKAVGVFGIASKLPDGLPFVATTFLASVYPLLSRAAATSQDDLSRIFGRSVRYLMLFIAPIAGLSALYAEDIILLFFGRGIWSDTGSATWFDQTLWAFRLLMWNQALSYAVMAFSQLQIALRCLKSQMVCFAVSAAVSLLLNLTLIGPLGVSGAAVATLSSPVAFLIVMTFSRALRAHIGDFIRALMKVLLATAAAGVTVHLLGIGLLLGALTGLSIYTVSVLVLGGLTREDLTLIRHLVTR